MSAEIVVRLVSGLLLIAANAFFVAVEFALTRLRGLEIAPEEIDEEGLREAWELTERLEIHLTGCQLGSYESVGWGGTARPGTAAGGRFASGCPSSLELPTVAWAMVSSLRDPRLRRGCPSGAVASRVPVR